MPGQPPHIHPPKIELFDVAAATNTDPKGFVRTVQEYRVEPFGLYMAREVAGHPRIAYLESWLLPRLGLRANDFWYHPGEGRDNDLYLDIADATVGDGVWRTVDHYLDIAVWTGRRLQVLDTDELAGALAAGLITPDTAERAMRSAFDAVEGLAAHGYNLAAWLAPHNITLTWKRR
jgi:predicted RNA-binding protein associated with RNAse of E/G family